MVDPCRALLTSPPNARLGACLASCWPAGAIRPLRRILRNLSDGLIVYIDEDREALLADGYKKPIYVAPNAIARSSQQRAITPTEERSSFLWIGRLMSAKKPRLAIDAFRLAIPELRGSTNLLIVGDGPERDECIASAVDLVNDGRVQFLGEIVNDDALAELFGSALSCVASGYVGLNATQSIGYGSRYCIPPVSLTLQRLQHSTSRTPSRSPATIRQRLLGQ